MQPGPTRQAAGLYDRDVLVESVPNVSEGRRLDVVERLADALTSVPGVFLLDRTSDPSHNRSVFTVAGEHDAVSSALERLVAQALDDIDMEQHTGEHPRIGAVDVIPFVPLGDTTMDDCVELARAFGDRIAGRWDLPVYLYAQAATRSDRVKLADVRRGQYEGLTRRSPKRSRARFRATRIHAARAPRPSAPGRSSSPATCTSTRRRMSSSRDGRARVRESGGGLPRVQANGFRVEEPERGHPVRAQVSMNLLDFRITPIWQAWEAVGELAAEDGINLAESELIGLAPLAPSRRRGPCGRTR